MARPFRLWKRKDAGRVYYYMLPGEGWHSTGKTTKDAALNYIQDEIETRKEELKKQQEQLSIGKIAIITFREYAEPFFIWDHCPHCLRIRGSGGQIGPEHAKHQRSLLERFIIGNDENEPDLIAGKLFLEIKRGDCIDLRGRLIRKLGVNIDDRDDQVGKRTVNAVMTVLSTIFSEAMERQELDYNPAVRLAIKYNKRTRGIFTHKELQDLFPSDVEKLGPWEDLKTKTAFMIAGTCGLRRNEVRALRWGNVDLADRIVRVYEAFKGQRRPGLPKWDKKRESSLPGIAARHLAHLHEISLCNKDEDLVFCYEDGNPIGTELWENAWNRAMKQIGVDRIGRNLVPHSLRHTIATELSAAGLSDALIRAGLGWTNPKTQENYTHLKPEHLRGQADIVDGIFE